MEIITPLSDEERAAIQERTTKDYLEAEMLNSLGVAGADIDLSKITCPIQRQKTVEDLTAAIRNRISQRSIKKIISGIASEKK